MGAAIATRAITADLREGGNQLGGPAPFAKMDRSLFLQGLDEVLGGCSGGKGAGRFVPSLTVGQLIDKVSALKFEVYHKQFSGPGYGGANYGDRVEINDDVFRAYVTKIATTIGIQITSISDPIFPPYGFITY